MSEKQPKSMSDLGFTTYDPSEAGLDTFHRIVTDLLKQQDEMNLILGLAIGQLVKEHVALDARIVDYLKRRGIMT